MGGKQSQHQPSTGSRARPAQAEHAARGMARDITRGIKRGITRDISSVIGVLVAVLILFLWLHFFVAHQNELTGRAIQESTAERERIERENMALRQKLAALWAEPAMAQRARTLDYLPQQPLFLLLNHPLVPTAGDSGAGPLLMSSIFQDVGSASGMDPAPEADLARGVSGDSAAITIAERP